MKDKKFYATGENLIALVESLLPDYLKVEDDYKLTQGNVALVIMNDEGSLIGKMMGPDPKRCRISYKVASQKATQVWLTGIDTGAFEKRVYNGELDPRDFGLTHPELVGWQGGQSIERDGLHLSIGFSGFRGINDLEIVKRAAALI